MPKTVNGSLENNQLQRPPAEIKDGEELERLRKLDSEAAPPGWQISLKAARSFIVGDAAAGITQKIVAPVSSIERMLVTLATGRGLMLVGDLLPEDGGFHAGNNHDESACHNGFDPGALRALCLAAGLDVLHLLPFHLVRKPDPTGALREYPLFFLAAKAV